MAASIVAGGMFLADGAAAQTSEAAAAAPWEGFYVGAHAAYHHGEVDDRGCVGLCARDEKVKELYLALQGGYDARVGGDFVLGAMAWVGVTPVKSEAELAPGIVVKGKTDFAGFLGMRGGLDRGPWLPYAFVGYLRVTGKITNEAAPIKRVKGKHNGIGLGVGAEYRLAPNFSVDGRYMYSNLSDEDYNMGGGTTIAGEHAHTFSMGVNYRF
ncbi:MAG TPA: outer membrane beta-barrel protein [Allosphingosinicella sp.]|nr:outer membrane beta-barrel protein [Allosphingosinicella sp.]